MSNFSSKLAEILERKKLRASELGRVTGINDGLISRWITGRQKFISLDDLAKICVHISTNNTDRAELIRAHLYDEMDVPGHELIEISIRGKSNTIPKPQSVYDALPLKLRRAFDLLAQEVLTDVDVRAVILGLAKVIDPNLEKPASSQGELHPLTKAAMDGAQPVAPRAKSFSDAGSRRQSSLGTAKTGQAK